MFTEADIGKTIILDHPGRPWWAAVVAWLVHQASRLPGGPGRWLNRKGWDLYSWLLSTPDKGIYYIKEVIDSSEVTVDGGSFKA